MLLGAGVGWMSRDRAIRRHVVEDAASRALTEADDLQKRDKWQEALAAAERAKAALASGEAGCELEQQVGERLADLQLIQRLEELRLKLGDEFDSGNQDRAYARLFAELGIDGQKLSPAEIAARIRQRPAVAVRIAAALDHWSKVRRDKLLYQKGDPATWKRLLEAARIADPDPWRAQLRQLMGQEDLRALRQLSETADIAALPVQSLDLLGNALIFGRDPKACVAWLRKVQQQHPDDVLINFDLAYHLSNLPAPPWYDVVRFYQAALAARPQSAHLHLDLAAALIKAGQSDKTLGPTPEAVNALQEAGKILDEQAAERPAAESIQLFLGHILWELGDAWLDASTLTKRSTPIGCAFTTFADLSARDPKNRYYRQETAYGYHKLAEIHAASGQLSISVDECRQAIPIYEALVTESPDNFFYREEAQHRYLELANCLKDAKQTQPAVKAGRQAIELQSGMLKFGSEVPDWWDRGIWLGQTLRELGQFADAEQVLQEAVDLWTKLVAERNLEDRRFQLGRSYEDLGHVYNTQHRFDQAVESYRRALDIFTKLVNEFNKPNYKDRQSWTQQSILNVLVLQLQQANVDAQLTDEQRKTKAQELRDQAVKLARDTIKTGWWANNNAWRLATGPDPQQRDPTLAIILAELAVEHASDDAKGMFLNTLGVAQYRAGQWQSAIDALHESMNYRNGGNPADWFFLAMAYWQLGQKDEARQSYDRGVQWMKDHESKNQELQRFQDEAAKSLKIGDQKPANDQPTGQTVPKPANPQ